jgi:RimJ/RimL family protein N-acetyltransferase
MAGGIGCEPKGDIRTGTAEVGWWLSPPWWGRGIAAIAVRRYLAYCFDDLDLHRVEAGVFVSNPASARVAEKAGFVLEGISRDAYLKNGELIDRLSYGLARSQWHRLIDVP